MKETEKRIFNAILSFFGIALGFSWLFWTIGILASYGLVSVFVPNMVLVAIGAHGPLVAALFLTGRKSGWREVKALLRSGFDFRMQWYMWVLILLLPVLLTGIAVWINVYRSGFILDRTLINRPEMILTTAFSVLFTWFYLKTDRNLFSALLFHTSTHRNGGRWKSNGLHIFDGFISICSDHRSGQRGLLVVQDR